MTPKTNSLARNFWRSGRALCELNTQYGLLLEGYLGDDVYWDPYRGEFPGEVAGHIDLFCRRVLDDRDDQG